MTWVPAWRITCPKAWHQDPQENHGEWTACIEFSALSPTCGKTYTHGMKKLVLLWEAVRSSFWFIPILIILGGLGAAVGMIYLDQLIPHYPHGILRFVYSGSAASARGVLSTISSAMIGVAGTVFSITLVALSLASSQFGPRLLRNFMTQRINQVVLGAYVSTYAYCLVVLNSIVETAAITFIPIHAVLVAIVATIANIILLILFIHNIAVSIQADHIIAEVSRSLRKSIRVLFPEEIGKEVDAPAPDVEAFKAARPLRTEIRSPEDGYLQDLDVDKLFEAVNQDDALLLLHHRPGDYLICGALIAEIFSRNPVEKARTLEKAFFLGRVRTPQQDAEYSVHQIVEMAARALSPGINDPYTAIACIDNLSAALAYLARVKFPSRYRYNEGGALRVVSNALTFEGMLDAAFNSIRQYSSESPAVAIRLMEALKSLHTVARDGATADAVRKHADMVMDMAAKHFSEPRDLADMRERYSAIG